MADNDMHNNGSKPKTSSPHTRNPPDTHCYPPVMPPLPWETAQPGIEICELPGTIADVPQFPQMPGQSYGQVRFINASTYNLPVDISIDETVFFANATFGTVSEYGFIADGFHTVTVRRATGPRTLLYEQTFPFAAGQMITMILTDNHYGGLDMVSISDTGCYNLPYNVSCFRFANMSYSGSAFDLLVGTGGLIFNNIGFQVVSTYKQAIAGTYRFYVTNAGTVPAPQILPAIIGGGSTGTAAVITQPFIVFDAYLAARQNSTAYVIGSPWSSDFPLQVLVVRDAIPSVLQPLTTAP